METPNAACMACKHKTNDYTVTFKSETPLVLKICRACLTQEITTKEYFSMLCGINFVHEHFKTFDTVVFTHNNCHVQYYISLDDFCSMMTDHLGHVMASQVDACKCDLAT